MSVSPRIQLRLTDGRHMMKLKVLLENNNGDAKVSAAEHSEIAWSHCDYSEK